MRTIFLLLLFGLSASAADISAFHTRLAAIAAATDPNDRQAAIGDLLGESQAIVTAVLQQATQQGPGLTKIVKQYRRLRADTQTGASNGSSGSTSLVLNPYVADILGVSFENGSVLKTISGNTINIQIKPAGIFCAASNQDSAFAAPGTGCLEFWKRIGFIVAFDKSRSGAPSQLVALQDDFSNFGLHLDLLEPTVKQARKRLHDSMNLLAESQTTTLIPALFESNSSLIHWRSETRAALVAAADLSSETERKEELQDVWSRALDEITSLFSSDADLRKETAGLTAFANLNIETNLRSLMSDKLSLKSFAFEYSFDRADVAKADLANGVVVKGQRPPNVSTARLIYAQNYQPLVLSANAQLSWFNSTLPGMRGNLRDWQISAAATFLLKEIPNFGKTTLSFGGLIGDLRQQPLGFNYTVPLVSDLTKLQTIDLAGPIRAFNTRLEFPTANKSITIPISFTYSNRTDLIKETDVRGSIGLTVRFDSFFPAK